MLISSDREIYHSPPHKNSKPAQKILRRLCMFRSYASMARLSFYDTSGLLRVSHSRNPDTHSHIVVLRHTLMLMCVRGTNPVSLAHASMARLQDCAPGII